MSSKIFLTNSGFQISCYTSEFYLHYIKIERKKYEPTTSKWIQLVKEKLSSEGMTQRISLAPGVREPTISRELLKYGKGSDRLKNRVCDVLGIDETWVDLGE